MKKYKRNIQIINIFVISLTLIIVFIALCIFISLMYFILSLMGRVWGNYIRDTIMASILIVSGIFSFLLQHCKSNKNNSNDEIIEL